MDPNANQARALWRPAAVLWCSRFAQGHLDHAPNRWVRTFETGTENTSNSSPWSLGWEGSIRAFEREMVTLSLQTVAPEGQRLAGSRLLRWDKDLVFKCQSQVPGQVWHDSARPRSAGVREVLATSKFATSPVSKRFWELTLQARQFWSMLVLAILARAMPAKRQCAPENDLPRSMLHTRCPCRQCLCPALPQKPS